MYAATNCVGCQAELWVPERLATSLLLHGHELRVLCGACTVRSNEAYLSGEDDDTCDTCPV